MSSAAYATPLRLELRSSRRLAVGMAALHVCAALIPWTLPVHPLMALLGSGLVLLSASRAWRLHLGGSSAIASLRWDAEDIWHFRRRDGKTERGRLLPQGYLHPRLAVLRYAVEREGEDSRHRPRLSRLVARCQPCRVLVLLPDSSADQEGLRRLRVRLRLES
ncbi:MAG: hypothetical protein RBT81_10260 [Gammaproteobacteria bacterium]|jgi:hypothetical protein|nr:hypothetical protein [Gammaproteobacteria bacterium]